MEPVYLKPIAVIESCYKQKFAIPRQSGLAPTGTALIHFLPEFSVPEAIEGLEQSSHIWVQFIFHGIDKEDWSPRVRPPRLGGNQKVGVFSTRSTHRPNPLGLSAVKLDKIDTSSGVVLKVSGGGFLDGTPVLDIKPYVPYADRLLDADHGFAGQEPAKLNVSFSNEALIQLSILQPSHTLNLTLFIREVLQQDPRPAYQSTDVNRIYGVNLLNFNLTWRYVDKDHSLTIHVIGLEEIT